MMDDDLKLVPPAVDFDHNSREFARNRVKNFDDVRDMCPVAQANAYGGYYVISGWPEVSEAATSGDVFSVKDGPTIPDYPKEDTFGMLQLDAPQGPALRRQLQPLFTGPGAQSSREHVRELVEQHIDEFIEDGEADLVAQLTRPVPESIGMRALGLSRERVSAFSDVYHRLNAADPLVDDMVPIIRDLDLMLEEMDRVIDARTVEPANDWISYMVGLRVDGEPMTRAQIRANSHVVLGGSVDTTTQLTSGTLLHLHRDRELRDRLASDPSLIEPACEEFLRYLSPAQSSARTVRMDADFGKFRLKGGERVLLGWGPANRDPRVFEDPDTVDVDRSPNRHLAFGVGAHKCPGQHLARVWFAEIVAGVLRRLPDYVVDEDGYAPYPAGPINGILRLPVTFSAGARGQ
jgi:cytochrome P450